MDTAKRAALKQLARLWCCPATDFRGQTLRQLFEQADSEPGVSVYWGCWSDAELDKVL